MASAVREERWVDAARRPGGGYDCEPGGGGFEGGVGEVVGAGSLGEGGGRVGEGGGEEEEWPERGGHGDFGEDMGSEVGGVVSFDGFEVEVEVEVEVEKCW